MLCADCAETRTCSSALYSFCNLERQAFETAIPFTPYNSPRSRRNIRGAGYPHLAAHISVTERTAQWPFLRFWAWEVLPPARCSAWRTTSGRDEVGEPRSPSLWGPQYEAERRDGPCVIIA